MPGNLNATQAESEPLAQSRRWVEQFVVKLSLCPFAREVMASGMANFRSVSGSTESVLEALMDECLALDKRLDSPTSLLIITCGYDRFDDYLELVEIAEQLLTDSGYEGIYQLATFHPAYQFADTDPDDVENFTNRSPYPIIQILRESAVEKVLESVDHPEDIPEQNIKSMQRLGINAVRLALEQCQ